MKFHHKSRIIPATGWEFQIVSIRKAPPSDVYAHMNPPPERNNQAMNRFAYLATGQVIRMLSGLSEAKVILHDTGNIPAG